VCELEEVYKYMFLVPRGANFLERVLNNTTYFLINNN